MTEEIRMGENNTCGCCTCDKPLDSHAGGSAYGKEAEVGLEYIVMLYHLGDEYYKVDDYEKLIESFEEFDVDFEGLHGLYCTPALIRSYDDGDKEWEETETPDDNPSLRANPPVDDGFVIKDFYQHDGTELSSMIDSTLEHMEKKGIEICMGWREECDDGTRRCEIE